MGELISAIDSTAHIGVQVQDTFAPSVIRDRQSITEIGIQLRDRIGKVFRRWPVLRPVSLNLQESKTHFQLQNVRGPILTILEDRKESLDGHHHSIARLTVDHP